MGEAGPLTELMRPDERQEEANSPPLLSSDLLYWVFSPAQVDAKGGSHGMFGNIPVLTISFGGIEIASAVLMSELPFLIQFQLFSPGV